MSRFKRIQGFPINPTQPHPRIFSQLISSKTAPFPSPKSHLSKKNKCSIQLLAKNLDEPEVFSEKYLVNQTFLGCLGVKNQTTSKHRSSQALSKPAKIGNRLVPAGAQVERIRYVPPGGEEWEEGSEGDRWFGWFW